MYGRVLLPPGVGWDTAKAHGLGPGSQDPGSSSSGTQSDNRRRQTLEMPCVSASSPLKYGSRPRQSPQFALSLNPLILMN